MRKKLAKIRHMVLPSSNQNHLIENKAA
jgi:hypothetical protein